MDNEKKIIVAISGASGSIYALRLLKKLTEMKTQWNQVGLVLSDTAKEIWAHETGEFSMEQFPFKIYGKNNFDAPFASGSSGYTHMIICPCSMGVLGRIANGISDDLITRAADVILKENKKLICVPRETPFNLIHIKNMEKIILAGGVILPASPSFYARPKSINDLVDTVVDRILTQCEFKIKSFHWGEE